MRIYIYIYIYMYTHICMTFIIILLLIIKTIDALLSLVSSLLLLLLLPASWVPSPPREALHLRSAQPQHLSELPARKKTGCHLG